MIKVQFQSPESFMQDYEQFKAGKRYKLINTEGIEYTKERLYVVHKDALHYWNTYIGEVDLQHKFGKVCVVD